MRHWTINGRFASQPTTGVQRYAREIVRALDRLIADNGPAVQDLHVELLVPPGSAALDLDAISVRTVGAFGGHAWEQVVLPAHAPGGLISLCNTGPVLHRRHVVCIHDLNTRRFPEGYSPAFRALYRVLIPALGLSARGVFTVSEHSAGEIAQFGIRPFDEIVRAPNGHEHALEWTPEHSDKTRRAAARDTIVLIGSAAPHKNARLIIGLAERLAEAGLRIAVVGAADPRVFTSDRPVGPVPGVEWLGRVTDAALAALLRDCMCLAFPSHAEGFGLPTLEAMALGCPVVASDRASLPEVCGDAALYAAPDDADAWFDQLMRLHTSPTLRSELVERGRVRIERFRWSRSAEIYLAAMAVADGLRPDAGGIEAVASPI